MMMPNYVDNTIVLDGVGSNDLLEGLYTDDCGEFDFERVIPCPTDLNQLANDKRDLNKILNVSITACIIAYLCQSQPTISGKWIDQTVHDAQSLLKIIGGWEQHLGHGPHNFEEFVNRGFHYHFSLPDPSATCMSFDAWRYNLTLEQLNAVLKIGKEGLACARNHGAISTYDWRLENWGCKWNASDGFVNDNTASFLTPWGASIPVVAKLAENHPNISIYYTWNDSFENCGIIEWTAPGQSVSRYVSGSDDLTCFTILQETNALPEDAVWIDGYGVVFTDEPNWTDELKDAGIIIADPDNIPTPQLPSLNWTEFDRDDRDAWPDRVWGYTTT